MCVCVCVCVMVSSLQKRTDGKTVCHPTFSSQLLSFCASSRQASLLLFFMLRVRCAVDIGRTVYQLLFPITIRI